MVKECAECRTTYYRFLNLGDDDLVYIYAYIYIRLAQAWLDGQLVGWLVEHKTLKRFCVINIMSVNECGAVRKAELGSNFLPESEDWYGSQFSQDTFIIIFP